MPLPTYTARHDRAPIIIGDSIEPFTLRRSMIFSERQLGCDDPHPAHPYLDRLFRRRSGLAALDGYRRPCLQPPRVANCCRF